MKRRKRRALLCGCARKGPEAEKRQTAPPSAAGAAGVEAPADGYTRDTSDPGAPKTIESRQIILFDGRFPTMDLCEPGELGNHIFQRKARLENGAVRGSFRVRDTGEEILFREDHRFLDRVFERTDHCDLAALNGNRIEVRGLPGDYGVMLEIEFASAERISVHDNQDCVLPLDFLAGITQLFRDSFPAADPEQG